MLINTLCLSLQVLHSNDFPFGYCIGHCCIGLALGVFFSYKHFGHPQGVFLLSGRIPLTLLGGLVCCGEATIVIYSGLVWGVRQSSLGQFGGYLLRIGLHLNIGLHFLLSLAGLVI